MKVVQLLSHATGGPTDHAVDVATELARRGHDVLVLMEDGPPARRAEAAGLRRQALGARSARDVAGMRTTVRLLRDERPDVVHCQDRRAGLVGRLAGRALRVPRTVYTLHGVPDSLSGLVAGNLQVAPPRRGDALRYLRAEQALAAAGAGPVVVPSAALADYAVRQVGLPSRQVHHVPNGVDADRFHPGKRRPTTAVLRVAWLGAVVPTKGLEVLLRAAAGTARVELLLAGTGELEGELRALTCRLGIADRTTWLGWVDDPAVLLGTTDALVLPSLAENLPLSVLQAMSAEAACVVTRVGGLPEMITDDVNGLLVPPGDIGALAGALRRLRDDVVLRERLGRCARRTVLDRFTLARSVDRLLEVYR